MDILELIDNAGQFERVTLHQYKKDFCKIFNIDENDEKADSTIQHIWENIKLPERSTKDSAGYDFFIPFDIKMVENSVLTIPTGIRCKIDPHFSLDIYPRSGLGFKYSLGMANTIPIIDSDYYGSSNEGHIMIKLRLPESTLNNEPIVEFNGECAKVELHYPRKAHTSYASSYTKRPALIVHLKAGDAFCQGKFNLFGKVSNEKEITTIRDGGMGSTSKK